MGTEGEGEVEEVGKGSEEGNVYVCVSTGLDRVGEGGRKWEERERERESK